MQYVDPHRLDKLACPSVDFDPDTDFIVLSGGEHTPHIVADVAHGGRECPACGCRRDDRLYRRRAAWNARRGGYAPQVGRVMCACCCKGSLDDIREYPGLPVGSAMDPDYPVDQPTTTYQVKDDGLAGGTGGKTKAGKGLKGRVKGKRKNGKAVKA